MHLDITLTKRDYAALYRQLINKRLFLISAVPLIIAIPFAAIALTYTGARHQVPLPLLLAPFIAIVGLAVWVFYRLGHAPALDQYRQAQQNFGARFVYELQPDAICCRAGEQEHRAAYATLHRYRETKAYIFLFVSAGEAFVFPKAALDSAALSLLKEKMPLIGTGLDASDGDEGMPGA